MKKQPLLLTLFLTILVICLSRPSETKAQVLDTRWSQPYRLSSLDSSAGAPYILADDFGYVHIFWVESGFNDGRTIIQYARFDGQTWSSPFDIYVTAPGGVILNLSPAIDKMGNLHLVWVEGETGPIFYMTAPAGEAMSVRNWTRPFRLEMAAYQVDLEVDSNGLLHLLYAEQAGPTQGLYYWNSSDGGYSWSTPRRLDSDAPTNLQVNTMQLVLDQQEKLHVVWTYIDLNIVGAAGTWVRYTNSFDNGLTWLPPVTIDEADETIDELRMAFPAMTVNGRYINIVYAGDVGVHREHRYSEDAGRTWSTTRQIFGDLLGQARGDGLALDGAGRVHFVGNIRWPTGLYHAYWDGQKWSETELVYLIRLDSNDTAGDRISAHDIRLAVRNGNQLVMAFGDEPAAPHRGLFVMQRTLPDLPLQPVSAWPTPQPTATLQPTPLPALSPTTAPVRPPFPTNLSFSSPAAQISKTLVLAIVPIFFFLALLLFFILRTFRPQ